MYYWRVRSVHNVSNVSDWSDVSSFFVDMTAPDTTDDVDSTWVKTDTGVTVTLTVFDDGGVAETFYCVTTSDT